MPRHATPESLRKFKPYQEIFAPVDEDEIVRFKSTRRTCKHCKYSWIDVNARKQCTKCWQSMTDGFTFLDTEFGQKMQRQMKVIKQKRLADEKHRWGEIHTAQENGIKKSGKDWDNFRAALLNADLGGGLSFEQRLAKAKKAKSKEMNKDTMERTAALRTAAKMGRSKSAEFWQPARENVRDLYKGAVDRKCSNCYHEWQDPFGRQECVKCGADMEDGIPPMKYPFEPHWSLTSAPMRMKGLPAGLPAVAIPGRDLHTR
jgi:hypothetical protein